ncbi:MAG: prolipoprotein diacylglyceryl transferase, partial [Caulobacteraceae bacterium]|nr:prolipoprotein diacylglyceryl transferase [Caulobacteraceae bacterium]
MQFPDFDPVFIHLGPIAIRWYGMAYVAGILLGWRYAVGLTRKPALWGSTEPTATAVQIDDLILWITFGIIVGGRLGSAVFYDANRMVSDPLQIFKIWQGGMSFHGGFIGVCVAVTLFARHCKIELLRLGDLVAAATPFGLLFGRIANFINGELWGRPTDVPWAIIFPAA